MWGTDMPGPEVDSRHVSLAKQLAAFARPRRSTDGFVHDTLDRGSDSAEGQEKPSASRRLLSDLGPGGLTLFGVPTDRGWVCTYLIDEETFEEVDGGTCEDTLVGGFGLDLSGEGTFYRLYGVVANDIEHVSVSADGLRYPAQIGENGFYFETKTTLICPVDIDFLIIERKNGSSEQLDFRRLADFGKSPRESFGCV